MLHRGWHEISLIERPLDRNAALVLQWSSGPDFQFPPAWFPAQTIGQFELVQIESSGDLYAEFISLRPQALSSSRSTSFSSVTRSADRRPFSFLRAGACYQGELVGTWGSCARWAAFAAIFARRSEFTE